MTHFNLTSKKKYYNYTYVGHEGNAKAENFLELFLTTLKDVRFGDLTFCLSTMFDVPEEAIVDDILQLRSLYKVKGLHTIAHCL